MENKEFWDKLFLNNKPPVENKPRDLNYTGMIFKCGMCDNLTGYVLDVEGCPGVHCCSLECYGRFGNSGKNEPVDEILITPIIPITPIMAVT